MNNKGEKLHNQSEGNGPQVALKIDSLSGGINCVWSIIIIIIISIIIR